MNNDNNKETCPQCAFFERRARGEIKQGETFDYFNGAIIFDVERAREIVKDGRDPVIVPKKFLQGALALTRINKEHIAHIDLEEPGILAVFTLKGNGAREPKLGGCLIDGHHRGQGKLLAGEEFLAYPLTEEETHSIITDNTGLNLILPPQASTQAEKGEERELPGNTADDGGAGADAGRRGRRRRKPARRLERSH